MKVLVTGGAGYVGSACLMATTTRSVGRFEMVRSRFEHELKGTAGSRRLPASTLFEFVGTHPQLAEVDGWYGGAGAQAASSPVAE